MHTFIENYFTARIISLLCETFFAIMATNASTETQDVLETRTSKRLCKGIWFVTQNENLKCVSFYIMSFPVSFQVICGFRLWHCVSWGSFVFYNIDFLRHFNTHFETHFIWSIFFKCYIECWVVLSKIWTYSWSTCPYFNQTLSWSDSVFYSRALKGLIWDFLISS